MGTDDAQDGDAQCTAELGAGLRQGRRRPGALGRRGSGHQVGGQGVDRGQAEREHH